jgi:transcriptional regulator with XRE-family HTH domain
MDLAEKLRELRSRAGAQRGLERPLTQAELAHAIHVATGSPISQGYVSQLENGKRTHLTEKTRHQLAAFFQVHPGYLVSDPAGGSHAPLAPHSADAHPAASHALARLAVHPQRHTLWALIDLLIDLPPDDLTDLHDLVRARRRAHP